MKRYVFMFAVTALIPGTSFAAINGNRPAFMDKQQLAAMRAEASSSQLKESTDPAFYTGKPYLRGTGQYSFLFRGYDPNLARWRTADPSGFPDGANNQRYASVPTTSFDFAGLLDWSTLVKSTKPQKIVTDFQATVTYDIWNVKTDDGVYTIELQKLVSVNASGTLLPGTDYSYNCHGYAFANGDYWINGQVLEILKGDGYKLITGDDKTKARVGYWSGNAHSALVNEVNAEGVVTKVTGKKGASILLPSTPAKQGYPGEIQYYE